MISTYTMMTHYKWNTGCMLQEREFARLSLDINHLSYSIFLEYFKNVVKYSFF